MNQSDHDTTEHVPITIELDDDTIERIADAVNAADDDHRLAVADRILDHVELDVTAVDSDGTEVADIVG
jgi:hypothetical protein